VASATNWVFSEHRAIIKPVQLGSYDRSVNGASCPFLSLVPVHSGGLIGGSFPVLFGKLDPVGEIHKLNRNRAEPDTTL